MEAVIVPARTVVHIKGVPVYLATDTIVETAYGNMSQLTGYHYASVPERDAVPVPPSPAAEPTKE